MKKLLLYARTIRTLRPSQICYLVRRRLLPTTNFIQIKKPIQLRSGININPNFPNLRNSGNDFEFRFLNVNKFYIDKRIDWACKDLPKHWKFHLHYFDYLLDPRRSHQSKNAIISDWVACNSPMGNELWEAYPLSMRVVNWIKFFLVYEKYPEHSWLESLWCQARWLEKNLEYHLRANHLLKNGVALFFAGLFFDGKDADRWRRKGLQILNVAFGEQFLSDGGHYERSPMYHALCIVDYLDILNILNNSRIHLNEAEIPNFTRGLIQSLDFLHDMCFPDEEISLFNDSVLGIAPSPHSIFKYAHLIMGYKRPEPRIGTFCIQKAQSGFFIFGTKKDKLIIDCGHIGPEFQPGHAHCDTLSYELALNGDRVIIDSGVHNYESGWRRDYARSTKGHNTVSVDNQEQSEIWGVFRVARRAKPIYAQLKKEQDGSIIFKGAHDGYSRLPDSVIHHRRIEFDGSSTWCITDELQGINHHTIESYIHLHPRYIVKERNGKFLVIGPSGKPALSLKILCGATVNLRKEWYFPEFGVQLRKMVFMISSPGKLPRQIVYQIRKEN